MVRRGAPSWPAWLPPPPPLGRASSGGGLASLPASCREGVSLWCRAVGLSAAGQPEPGSLEPLGGWVLSGSGRARSPSSSLQATSFLPSCLHSWLFPTGKDGSHLFSFFSYLTFLPGGFLTCPEMDSVYDEPTCPSPSLAFVLPVPPSTFLFFRVFPGTVKV